MKCLELLRKLKWCLIYWGPRRDVTVATLNGLLTLDSKDWLIGKYLYVSRSHEMLEIRGAIDLLRREGYLDGSGKGTVLNVGANIGMTCIALLKLGYFERAVAFEPTPNTYRLLVRNINQNGFQERIRHFHFALSSADGEAALEISGDNSGDNRIRTVDSPGFFRENERHAIQVPVRTLDRVFAEDETLRDDEVKLVWVDIQGHEGHFFEGARHLLSRGVPVVSELWPYAIGRSGMALWRFCQILSELFTDFYLLSGETPERQPISRIGNLLEAYSQPRQMCMVILVQRRG
jgi:FkbM family methyltransferase